MDCPVAGLRHRYAVPLGLALLACAAFTPAAHAQFVPFARLSIPVGVATDARGNLFVSHDNVSATLVSKFAADGTLLGSVQIGGFLDVGALGTLASTASGTLLLLLTDGRLLAIDPNTLSAGLVLDLRRLAIEHTSIYDVFSGTVSSFGGTIQPPFATFGDLAVLERAGATDLFITGLSQAQTFAFVLRLRIVGNVIREAKVLMSSAAETVTDERQKPRLPRGIAVNARGTVLTTLPYARVAPNGTASPSPFDVAVAFSADFDPADGIQPAETPLLVLGDEVDLYSQGMTTDAAGNFYVVTNAVGSAALGRPGEGALVVLPAALNRVALVTGMNELLTSFRDVALSPGGDRAYVSVDLFSVGPAPDVVVTTPLPEIVPSDRQHDTPLPPRGVLEAPYPNPFRETTTLRFTPGAAERVRVSLYDVLGRRVALLLDATVPAGVEQTLSIDGTSLPGGLYLVRLESPSFSTSRTLLRVR